MKKLRWFLAALLVLTALTACKKEEPELTFPKLEEPETTAQTDASVPSPDPTQPENGHIMSPLAVEDFMTPLEEHSWEREHDPEFVMLHFTSAVVNNRKDPFNIGAIREIFFGYDVSIHYIIERDGTIHCYIPEDRVAWHAGYGTYGDDEKYTDNMNLYAIGVEIIGIGTQTDMSDYLTAEEYAALDPSLLGFTDAQYEAVRALAADICQRNNIPFDREHVIGHSDFTHGNHDPGEALDWDRILG